MTFFLIFVEEIVPDFPLVFAIGFYISFFEFS